MTRTRPQLLQEAATLVRRVVELSRQGASGYELGQAVGYADGFMRSLLDAHLCTNAELLEIVRVERTRVDGPALRIDGRESAPVSEREAHPIEAHLAAVA